MINAIKIRKRFLDDVPLNSSCLKIFGGNRELSKSVLLQISSKRVIMGESISLKINLFQTPDAPNASGFRLATPQGQRHYIS
jgi:hypothetical protein